MMKMIPMIVSVICVLFMCISPWASHLDPPTERVIDDYAAASSVYPRSQLRMNWTTG